MALSPGSRLGPYEIVAPLGAGGMGEVYRAKDPRLGREVAIKVLPAELSGDAERRARFEQEARSASALNHPNIVTLYDIGTQDGALFIAMERVEGRSLRELLSGEGLPVRKLLDVAVQMADGLAKAHAAGIVHRDLKPENVMVSKDGFVKILDFGLAKLVQAPAADVSNLPTAVEPATRPGTVMGTVGYMSPEQASGQSVDFHSDQFSFGSILYEMATGKRAFQKATSVETMSAIIREEPEPVARANPNAPPPLRWIVERCLAKDPDERYASTRDLARDLASVRDHLSETSIAQPALSPGPTTRRRRGLLLGVIAAAVLLAIGFAAGKWTSGRRANLDFERLTFRRGEILTARFTPDGQSVVYGAAWEGNPPEIFVAQKGSPESRSLGLPPADILAVSSSGELAILENPHFVLGWEVRGTLARVPLAGGAPRQLLEDVQDADWSPDGKELAVVREFGGRRRLEYPVGKVLYETSGWISSPRVSPDGRWIAFADHPQRGDSLDSLAVVGSNGGKKKTLTDLHAPIVFAWSPKRDEIWCNWGSRLRSVTLDGKQREITSLGGGGWFLADVWKDGRVLLDRRSQRREIVAGVAGSARERNLTWLDWSFPTGVSEDGKFVLFDEQNQGPSGNYPIYLRPTDGSAATLLGQGGSYDLSPDGRWALTSSFPAKDELFLLPTGPGQPRSLGKTKLTYQWATFFPDGRRVLATANEPGRGPRLFVQDVSGGKPRAISPEGVTALGLRAVSPDGRSIAATGPDRRIALYSVEPSEPRPVAGVAPDELAICWTPDGRGLYVWKPSEMPAHVSIVDVATGHRTTWREIVPPDPAGILGLWPIVITPDGKSYAYSYRRVLGDLYLAEGLK
jgi:eukaryotic-like serine/threonine-protein kinase